MPAAKEATHRSAQTFYETALLGMLASGYFAVLGSGELDLPTAALMFVALCVRALRIAGLIAFEVPQILVTLAAVAYVFFYPLDIQFVSRSFLAATVHMIFFLAVIKILTASTLRDYTYLKLIAGMELLAAALLSIHLSFFAFLATFVLCGIATFSAGEMLRAMRSGSLTVAPNRSLSPRLTGFSLLLFAGILCMTAGLFFVLPRTARAAFQRFVPQRYHLPGFASQIALGQIGELKQNSAPVMHIRSYDQRSLATLRWRGSTLMTFDGQRWFNPPVREERLRVDDGRLVLPSMAFSRSGRSIGYEVQMSDIAPDTLFFAGQPETISIQAANLFRSVSGSIRAPRFGLAGLRYGAYSRIENEHAAPSGPIPPLSAIEHDQLLQLPKLDPRITELARSWATGAPDAEHVAQRMEDHFHRDFRYSLAGLQEEVNDPLAHFLFETKQGHCEYFASSMAVMLRTQGIPARVATGFLGGEFNSLSGWQVIRASDAHSWVEAWIPGRGWMTFDPTPPDPTVPQPTLWNRATLLLDAADQFWRDWVLSYDLDHQLVLASRVQSASRARTLSDMLSVGTSLPAWNPTVAWWAGGALLLLGSLVFVIRHPHIRDAWKRRKQLSRARRGEANPSDATLLYARMLQLLARHGYQKPAWLTPSEFAHALPTPELSHLVGDLTAAYNQVRFGAQTDAAPRMAQLLQRIETLLA
jgi:transglutaminase-like putative cysteine protease